MTATATPADTYAAAVTVRLAAERKYLAILTRNRVEAVRDRCPAFVLDEARYAIARQEAVVYRKPAVLHIDLDKQLYWVTQAEQINSDSDAAITLRTTALSPRVTLISAQVGEEPAEQQGQMDMTFRPNGTCDALTVVFRGQERGSFLGLTVDPITASATAYPVQ